MSIVAITSPDFDPSKPQGALAASALVSFCPPDPTAKPPKPASDALGAAPAAPPPPTADRLVVIQAQRDQFGLANWYNFRLLCEGHPPHTIWMKASEIEALLQSGRITRPQAG
jgi:hypothetical protein